MPSKCDAQQLKSRSSVLALGKFAITLHDMLKTTQVTKSAPFFNTVTQIKEVLTSYDVEFIKVTHQRSTRYENTTYLYIIIIIIIILMITHHHHDEYAGKVNKYAAHSICRLLPLEQSRAMQQDTSMRSN